MRRGVEQDFFAHIIAPIDSFKNFRLAVAFWQSLESDQVIEVDASDLVGLGTVDPIRLRDGVVFRSPKGTVYISENDKRRGIPDQETLRLLGYNNTNPLDVSWTEVNLLPETEKFEKDNLTRPDGTFIKTAENPAVYLLDEGKKRPFWGREILRLVEELNLFILRP